MGHPAAAASVGQGLDGGAELAPQGVFEDVCQAVLERLGVSPEDYRCQFRASRMMGGARQLEDVAARWLRSGWGGSAAQSGHPRAIRGGLIGSAATARQI